MTWLSRSWFTLPRQQFLLAQFPTVSATRARKRKTFIELLFIKYRRGFNIFDKQGSSSHQLCVYASSRQQSTQSDRANLGIVSFVGSEEERSILQRSIQFGPSLHERLGELSNGKQKLPKSIHQLDRARELFEWGPLIWRLSNLFHSHKDEWRCMHTCNKNGRKRKRRLM